MRFSSPISLLLASVLLFFIPLSVSSQGTSGRYDAAFEQVRSQTQIDSLQDFSQREMLKSVQEKEKAWAIAKEKGWDTRVEREDGSVIELIRIDEYGFPVYYTTQSNLVAARSISTDKVWPGGSLGLNLTGAGLTIREWDESKVRLTHDEFQGRAVQGDGATNLSSHATHVAGTLIGAGANAQAKGGSFEANLRAFDWNSDGAEMAAEAANGSLVSNHSYGTISGWSGNRWYGNPSVHPTRDWRFGFYNSGARNWDNIARNAPYYLIFKSAGNDRNDNRTGEHEVNNGSGWETSFEPRDPDGQYDCIAAEGTAKNILTIGATNDVPNGWAQTSDVSMSSFSSWGPVDDGRVKPDVVANGVGLLSSDISNDSHYTTKSGTSMSGPSAAGSALLLQQHYHDNYGQFMRSSTLKGLILHTADEAGRPGPDYSYGWGLMNTATAANHITENKVRTHILEETLKTGKTYSIRVFSDGTEPLMATVCWTDPAGRPIAAENDNRSRMLVNDLDIRISDGPTTWQPYVLDPNNPTANATLGDNIIDNVEQIRIANPVAGYYTITVTHKGTLVGDEQIFSLLISRVACFAAVLPSFDQAACASGTFDLVANSGTGFTYQWFRNNNLIPGANQFEFSSLIGGNYTVQVNNGTCTAESLPLTLTIDPVTVGGNVAANPTFACYGSNTGTLTVNGSIGSVVRWEYSEDSWTTVNTIANTNSSLAFSNLIANRQYRAVVKSGVCNEELSTDALVTVFGNGGTVSSGGTVCLGTNSGTLTLNGHTGNILYWEQSNDNWASVTSLSNNSNQLFYSGLTADTRYRAVIRSLPCPEVRSTDVLIEVIPLLDLNASSLSLSPMCVIDGSVALSGSYNENSPYDRCNEYRLSTIAFNAEPHAGTNVFNSAVDDGNATNIPIGFDFTFYCDSYNEITVSSNGFIMFEANASSGCCSGEVLPDVDQFKNLIAGCWTDNRLINADDVKYQTVGTAPNRKFILSFGGDYEYYASDDVTFQIILHEGSNEIDIVHIDIPASSFTRTCGIEDKTQTLAVVPSGMNASSSWSSFNTTYRFRPSNSPAYVSYQWNNASNGFSATTPDATDLNPPLGSSIYKLEVTHGYTGCKTTLDLPMQVDVESVGGVLGPDRTVCINNHNDLINLTGNTGSVVRWEVSPNNWATTIPFMTTVNPLPLTNLGADVSIQAVVKSGSCPENTSSRVNFIVSQPPFGGTLSQDMTLCSGLNSAQLLLSGQTGNVVRWEKSDDNFASSLLIANVNPVLNLTNETTSYRYRAVVNNGICPDVVSNPVSISLDLPSLPGSLTANQRTVCANNNSGFLQVSGQRGQILYWNIYQTAPPSFQIFPSSSNPLPFSNMSSSTMFSATIKNGVCPAVNTNWSFVNVQTPPVGGTVTGATTQCHGEANGIVSLSGHKGVIRSWEMSEDGGVTWQPIPYFGTNLPYNQLNVSTLFRAVIKQSPCADAVSSTVQVSVLPGGKGGQVSSSQSLCSGYASGSLVLTGFDGNVSHWESSTDNWNSVQTINNASSTLAFNNLTTSTAFRAVVQKGTCLPVRSVPALITILPAPLAGTTSSDQAFCGMGTGQLFMNGNSAPVVRWERSTDQFATKVDIPSTSQFLTFVNIATTTQYRAVVSNGVCPDQYAQAATVTIYTPTIAGTVGGNLTVCANNPTTTLQLTGATGNPVRWETSTDNWQTVTQYPIPSASFQLNQITVPTVVRVWVQNGTCAGAYTPAVRIMVNAPPVAGILMNTSDPNNNSCSQTRSALILSGFQGAIERWEVSYDAGVSWTTITNATPLYDYSTQQKAAWYRVAVSTTGCAVVYSNVLGVTPVFGLSTEVINGCGASTIHVQAYGGAPGYDYFLIPTIGSESPAGQFNNIPAGTYYVYARDARFCYTFKQVTVGGPPDAPTITNVALNKTGKVVVKWNSLAPHTGINYQMRYRKVNDLNWLSSGASPNTRRSIGLTAGFTYEFQVRAFCTANAITLFSTSEFFEVPANRETVLSQTESIGFSLYPNPNPGAFTIIWSDLPAGNLELQIFDLSGKLVWTENEIDAAKEQHAVLAQNLANGLYLIRFKHPKGSWQSKIQVLH